MMAKKYNHRWSLWAVTLYLILWGTLSYAQEWSMPDEAERCPSKWGVDDQRGSANMMNPASILKAMQLVKTGKLYELGEILTSNPEESYINRGRQFNIYTKPTIPKAGTRVASEELVITELGQIGTQIDGFAHQMHGDSFYNCFKFSDIATRTGYSKLGIENVGTLISRGVLVDIAALKGVAMLEQDYVISTTDIQSALDKQNVSLQAGDAVIINTGWGKNRGINNSNYGSNTPGIDAEAGLWLVKQQPILLGSDTCCVEFRSAKNRRLDVHSMMLIEHGIYLIENMELEALAAANVYEFLFIVQPLKIKGATGSAVAPVAIH
ncbi:MAG: kynurenine formamidase [Gammaproteobacteria bacterium]|jgi:kynurenine formamidase